MQGQVYGLTFAAPHHRPARRLVRRQDFFVFRRTSKAMIWCCDWCTVPDLPGRAISRMVSIGSNKSRRRLWRRGRSAMPHFPRWTWLPEMAFLNIRAKLREAILDGARSSDSCGNGHAAIDRVFLFSMRRSRRGYHVQRVCRGAGTPSPGKLSDIARASTAETHGLPGNVNCRSLDAMPLPGGDPRRWCTRPTWTSISDEDSRTRRSGSRTMFRAGHKTGSRSSTRSCSQGILPRYTLDPAPSTTARAMPTLRSVSAPVSRARRPRASRAARVKVRATRARKKKSR
jgi:hypothetical protein